MTRILLIVNGDSVSITVRDGDSVYVDYSETGEFKGIRSVDVRPPRW